MRPQKPVHRLHRLEISVILATQDSHGGASIAVAGRSNTQRANLWNYAEAFEGVTNAAKGYGMHDAVAHIVLACQQDYPRTVDQLEFALRGGVKWSEPPLF